MLFFFYKVLFNWLYFMLLFFNKIFFNRFNFFLLLFCKFLDLFLKTLSNNIKLSFTLLIFFLLNFLDLNLKLLLKLSDFLLSFFLLLLNCLDNLVPVHFFNALDFFFLCFYNFLSFLLWLHLNLLFLGLKSADELFMSSFFCRKVLSLALQVLFLRIKFVLEVFEFLLILLNKISFIFLLHLDYSFFFFSQLFDRLL